MYLREVGKLALYVRKKEWLMRLGSLGYIRRFHFWEFASEAGGLLLGDSWRLMLIPYLEL